MNKRGWISVIVGAGIILTAAPVWSGETTDETSQEIEEIMEAASEDADEEYEIIPEEDWSGDAIEEASIPGDESTRDDGFALIEDGSVVASGECGTKSGAVFWRLDTEGVLYIYGEGAMQDWTSAEDTPWAEYAEQVTSLEIDGEVADIGSYAFGGCSELKEITIG